MSPSPTAGRSGDRPCSSTNIRRRQRLNKTQRLRTRREFLLVQRGGRNRRAPHFIVVSRTRRDDGPTRLGVTVSRRVGNAVARNRIKRRVREFFRHHQDRFPPALDLVIVARTGADKLSHVDVVRELRSATGV